MANISEISNFIFNMASKALHNSYRSREYQNVVLQFTFLKRLNDVLDFSKKDVINTYEANKNKTDLIHPLLIEKAIDTNGKKLGFYNYSRFDFQTLLQDPENIEENIKYYINSFSDNIKDILQNFDIEKQIVKLSKDNALYKFIKIFETIDLSPKTISDHDMEILFEELIFESIEMKNKLYEYCTPKDVVKLMTNLLFIEEDGTQGSVKSVYDPACGIGEKLTTCKEFITENNPGISVELYGQEVTKELYALCKANMLMKGENIENIKGPSSTLSDDQFPSNKFDYIIYTMHRGNWMEDKEKIRAEAKLGHDGRFWAGVPFMGSEYLFIQHALSKMKDNEKSRIVMPIHSGFLSYSPRFTLLDWILENDYLEALISLPDKLFFHDSNEIYILILNNQKNKKRKGKVQLIDAHTNFNEIKQRINGKENEIDKKSLNKIIRYYKNFKENNNVKIFNNEDFKFKQITINRPLKLNYQVNNERLKKVIEGGRFKALAKSSDHNLEVRIKKEKEGREKQKKIKKALLSIGDDIYTDKNVFEEKIKEALKEFDLYPLSIEFIIDNLSEYDETAECVKNENGEIIPDTDLSETKRIPLKTDIQNYFDENVLKFYPDAWFDHESIRYGYEINFKHLMFNEKLFFEDIPYPLYYLDDLVSLNRISNNDRDNYDLFIKFTNKKVIYYPHEFSDIKSGRISVLAGCQIKSNKILKDYLYYYLNSNKGLTQASYFQKNFNISFNDLQYLQIPVPDIETQKKIVETCRLMDEFYNEITMWKKEYSNNILNYEPTLESYKEFSCSIKFGDDGGVKEFCRNWRIVYQGLIWPLAYTYLKATKGSKNESNKNYITLFEFLAAFNVIVLISAIKDSGLSDGKYQEIKNTLWNMYNTDGKRWHMMHFGDWTTLYKQLRKIYRDNDFETPFDRKFFDKLSSKKYENLFQKLRAKERNPESHCGLEDDIDREAKLEELKNYTDTDIFNILNLYSGLKLYYIECSKPKTPKKKCYKVMSLNGPCDPPNYHKFISEVELDVYSLYLYHPLENSFLKLDNDLIKFEKIKNSKQYGIYLYDGVDERENIVKYKCYQHKNEFFEISLKTDEDTFLKVSDDFLIDILRII